MQEMQFAGTGKDVYVVQFPRNLSSVLNMDPLLETVVDKQDL